MKKVLISVLLLLFCIAQTAAQHDSQISQYTFFPAAFNPATVGQTGMIQAVAMNRMDFFAMGNNDTGTNIGTNVGTNTQNNETNTSGFGVNTTNVGVNMPFRMGGASHGAGIRFMRKQSGSLWLYQNAYLQYAFKRTTPIGNFSVGIDFGFVSSGFDGTNARPVPQSPPLGGGDDDGGFHQQEPGVIPSTEVMGMGLDINLGVMYSFGAGYVGFSVLHITQPKLLLEERETRHNLVDTVPRSMHLMGAYRFRVPDTRFTVKPHTLIRTNFIIYEWHLGALIEYDERFWGGLSTRIGTTVGGMTGINTLGFTVGMNIVSGLSAGLVYDLPTTRLINTFGSVELVLEYRFEFLRNRHNNRHKSIRIL